MENKALSLLELQQNIKYALDEKLDTYYWTVAEISELNISQRGHCYMVLVQKDEETDRILARVRGIIWSMKFRMLSAYFEKQSKESLKEGLKIMVKARVDYHELYGMSLHINDIDPAYTLGDVEKRREEIIQKLQEAGITDMNKTLDLPLVIQRIAVISSDTAAGFGDFISQMETNNYNFYFGIDLFRAAMQGDETEQSVIAALEEIYNSVNDYDIVVIIRGGGAKTDLSYFDNFNIAANVAQFPLPVFSGIGHERDKSVTDMVAHTHLKTPTAVAESIISYNKGFDESIDEELELLLKNVRDYLDNKNSELTNLSRKLFPVVKDNLYNQNKLLDNISLRLQRGSFSFIKRQEQILDSWLTACVNSGRHYLNDENRRIDNYGDELKKKTASFISNAKHKLENDEKLIKANDPARLLEKGYTFTLKKGKIVKSADDLKKGEHIKTRFQDGTIDSEIL